MDSGWAALFGALVGSLSGPISAWVSEHFRNADSRKIDKLRKERLAKILRQPSRKWRAIDYLADAVGATETKTKRLLLEIGARKSMAKGKDTWALVERVPFPDDAEQDVVTEEAESSHLQEAEVA